MLHHISLISLLTFFVIITPLDSSFYGESSLVEILQITFLLSNITINLRLRKLFINYYNSFSYYLKLLLILFILYEEVSFITRGMNEFFNIHNYQSEINLHNSNFLQINIFKDIYVPVLNQSFNINLWLLINTFFILLLGFVSFFPYLKKIRFFSVEKKYSPYFLLYFFTIDKVRLILLNFQESYLQIINGRDLIDGELYELFIYLILLIDTINKSNIIKIKNQKRI